MKTAFKGVFPALITPLTKDEKLNVSALEKLLISSDTETLRVRDNNITQ